MKRFNLMTALIAVVLMTTVFSCTTLTPMQDDTYYERSSSPNRIYVDDPYRGTVVLEKDPYSGRYYEVSSYGRYDNRVSRNNNDYYGRNYDNRNRNYNRSNQPRVSNPGAYSRTQEQPTEEQKKEQQQNKEEARKKVLGN